MSDFEASSVWAVGTRLVLDGLSTTALNGAVASVAAPLDPTAGRYVVKLEIDDREVSDDDDTHLRVILTLELLARAPKARRTNALHKSLA